MRVIDTRRLPPDHRADQPFFSQTTIPPAMKMLTIPQFSAFARRSGCRSAAHWEERAQPAVAQVQAAPGQNADIDPEEDLAKERFLQAQFAGDRPAEKAGNNDRAEYGRA